jgi:hypothetical protein
MDQCSQSSGNLASDISPRPKPHPAVPRGPALTLVPSTFALALPQTGASGKWRDALACLLAWLGIEPEFSQVGDAAITFAPWHSIAATTLTDGSAFDQSDAKWTTSYCIDQGLGRSLAQRTVDVVLMSTQPGRPATGEPTAAVLEAMIGAAASEGRERIAIIHNAHQRDAIAGLIDSVRLADRSSAIAIEPLAIEHAQCLLGTGAITWDAVIAMPELRGSLFAMLARASRVCAPWPMVWHHVGEGGPCLIASATAAEQPEPLALDAQLLIHALALALDRGGQGDAASRLHRAWARLRDSGVTTAGRASGAPYLTILAEIEFIAALTKGLAPSNRPVAQWRAIGQPRPLKPGRHSPALRVIA